MGLDMLTVSALDDAGPGLGNGGRVDQDAMRGEI